MNPRFNAPVVCTHGLYGAWDSRGLVWLKYYDFTVEVSGNAVDMPGFNVHQNASSICQEGSMVLLTL